jgi:transcription initiation factor TFIIIB Brf1 subunit/transcription initiation factor TFIIB
MSISLNPDDDIWGIMSDMKEMILEEEEGIKDIEIVCVCGSKKIVIEDSMQICEDCSSILGKELDNTAEWRFYGNDNKSDDPSRCGLPTNVLLPKSSLGSIIGGNKFGSNYDIRLIRKYQMWNAMPYNERTLWNVFDKLTGVSLSNGIPQKIIDDAKVLYKKASEKKISRGNNKQGLIASCIYHACLMNNLPRSSKEIAKMFDIDPIVLNKGNSRFQTLLQINVSSSSPLDFISRYCSNLDMKMEDIENCKLLAKFLDETEIMSDDSPTSSCASILYYYSKKRALGITKKQFSDVCQVSEVTVEKGFKRLEIYDKLINKKLKLFS